MNNKIEELIKISNQDGNIFVSARNFHKLLEIKADFQDWWDNIDFQDWWDKELERGFDYDSCGLEEEEDFYIVFNENQEEIDCNLTLDATLDISQYLAYKTHDPKRKEIYNSCSNHIKRLIAIRDKPILDIIYNVLNYGLDFIICKERASRLWNVKLHTLLETIDLRFEEKENILYIQYRSESLEANFENVNNVIEGEIYEVGRHNENYYDGTEGWY